MLKSELVVLIRELRRGLIQDPGEWENKDLAAFLEAMADWIEDMEGYYENTGNEPPSGKALDFLRDALMAAKVYE